MQFKSLVFGLVLFLSAFSLFAEGEVGKFDYYVMSLSWSPDYCAFLESKKRTDSSQCTVGKKLGFVLHGVWPQYIKGFPSDCTSEKLSEKVADSIPNLYPSEKLYHHEWEKHGTCSGLTPEKYLEFSKNLKEGLKIPANYINPPEPFRTTIDSLQKDFIAANPGFSANSFAPACSGSGRFLQELRICYDKEGKSMECSAEVLRTSKKSCAQADFLVRSVK